MKKALYVVILLLLVSSVAFAQLPPQGYMALCTDQTAPPDYYNTCGVTDVELYSPVEMYIWFLPSDRGQMCAEFMLVYPDNVLQSTLTQNYGICEILGTLDTGMRVCYCECKWAWNWMFHQTIYLTDFTPACIKIAKHPDNVD